MPTRGKLPMTPRKHEVSMATRTDMRELPPPRAKGNVIAATAVAAGVTATALAAYAFLGPGDDAPRADATPAPDASFEEFATAKVATVQGAWLAGDDDVLVLPASEAGATEGTPFPVGQVGPLVKLPANSYETLKAWDDESSERAKGEVAGVMVADRGQAYLACTKWPGQSACTVSVGHLEDDTFIYDFGLGSDDFQAQGSKMEVFTIPQYAPEGTRTLVIAGSAASAQSADIVLDDGTQQPASLTRAVGLPTGAIMFAVTTAAPTKVVTYGADGQVIEDHTLRTCAEGENCELR